MNQSVSIDVYQLIIINWYHTIDNDMKVICVCHLSDEGLERTFLSTKYLNCFHLLHQESEY